MNRSHLIPEKPKAPAPRDPFADGFNARMKGHKVNACPFRRPADRAKWAKGYRLAVREGVGD